MLRWRPLRRPLDVLFLLTCVALTACVLVPEIRGNGKTKDYPLCPRPRARAATWVVLALAGALMCLSLPLFPLYLQAMGNNLAATAVLVAGLVWHIKHPLSQTATRNEANAI